MRQNRKWLAAVICLSLATSGCDVPIGEARDLGEVDTVAPILTIRYRNVSSEAGDGEPIGVTVVFDLVDQDRYGLQASAELVADDLGDFPRTDQSLENYPQQVARTDPEAGCFEPIQFEDHDGQTLLTVEDFCGGEKPTLFIHGDLGTGEGLGWSYESAGENISVLLDK